MFRRRKSSTPCHECHHHIHHHHGGTLRRGNHHEHVHHVHAHMSNTLRSKSTGQLIDDHHIRGSTRSRSRSKSKLDCSECYDNAGLSRSDRQSTRSTRWEVYRHVESPKKHLNSSQRRKSPIYKVTHFYVSKKPLLNILITSLIHYFRLNYKAQKAQKP